MFERTRVGFHLPSAVIAASVVSLVGTGVILFNDWNTEQQLQRMPADARRVLFEHLQETLRRSCPQAKGEELREYCQEQAQFLARFPECGASCQDLYKQYAPRATK